MLHQYKNAIDRSNIVSKTDINGIITYVNEEFCKISGYTREELVGKNHNIVRHPDVPKERFEEFWRTILAKQIWKGTVQNRAKDGSTFYVNTTVIPITDYRGKIVEFVAIRYDVTRNIQLQEKLRRKEQELAELNRELERRVEEQTRQLKLLNASLEERIRQEVAKNRQKDRMMFQQAKLASLGEMLGNIAHQWRQPLMELSILLYKMKKGQDIEQIYRHGIALIERMNQTIIDFQNFYLPDKRQEFFNVRESIEGALSIVAGSLEREQIEVVLKGGEGIEVCGYGSEFAQVILNLISNAKDALKERVGEKRIEIEILEEADEVLIEVMDNGPGIGEDILDKIFEPYFTTKGKGTGLGLYMSKMIVEESMGGRLIAQNVKGGGAKFTIYLPKRECDGVQGAAQTDLDPLCGG
ncbi:MAG: PAS domain-containing sensor histidine kinase [Nitratiruptor sp.]|nr:PAS domain-containing sensor histidine kinase [Nitratiruptor sp.]NPA83853.1 PAS domain S-box protein [Campylobacterota bacterium]